jgi:hypothetical protein
MVMLVDLVVVLDHEAQILVVQDQEIIHQLHHHKEIMVLEMLDRTIQPIVKVVVVVVLVVLVALQFLPVHIEEVMVVLEYKHLQHLETPALHMEHQDQIVKDFGLLVAEQVGLTQIPIKP